MVEPPDLPALRSLLIVCVAWACFNQGLVFLFSFGPGFLVGRGLPRLDAAFITSLPLWIAILSIPVGTLLILLVLAIIAGVIAAIGPARRASRLDVLEALAYE